MLNHVRTLLANVDAPDAPLAVPGEELIEPGYRASNLPSYLDTLRGVLFGADPDRLFLNYRLWQYMALLHASPLAGDVTAADPRVTYDFATDPFLDAATFTPTVHRLSAAGRITVFGSPEAPDPGGRAEFAFRVAVSGGAVSVKRSKPRIQNALLDDPGAPFALMGSGYKAQITEPGTWLIEFANRPQYELGQIAASLGQIGEPVLLQLFGVGSAEPYATYRSMWQDARPLPQRLGALLMAVALRTEESRRAGG